MGMEGRLGGVVDGKEAVINVCFKGCIEEAVN